MRVNKINLPQSTQRATEEKERNVIGWEARSVQKKSLIFNKITEVCMLASDDGKSVTVGWASLNPRGIPIA